MKTIFPPFFKIQFFLLLYFPIKIITNLQLSSPYSPYSNTIEYYTINTTSPLKIGIISDSQIMSKIEHFWLETFTYNLKESFEFLKKENVDIIIFAGDLGDGATELAWSTWRKTFDSIYTKDDKIPILNVVMGNHDYNNNESPTFLQEQFEYYIKEKPFSHKVINGIHFINWGNENKEMDDRSNQNIKWAREQIEIAIKENPNNPIIITTHLNPRNTVYGSDYWGNNNIYNLFKNYPQIISLSGHSHYSLMDERSIWQGDFTAIQTQSVSYIGLDFNRENGCIPRDEYNSTLIASNTSMGLIMEIFNDKIEIKRISFVNKKFVGDLWIINLPINKKDFIYTNRIRLKNRVQPYFEINNDEDKKVEFLYDQFHMIKFKQAYHPVCIYNYKIIFKDEGNVFSYLYYSDFYLIPELRAKKIRLKIPDDLSKGIYNVTIIAIESFGLESSNNLTGTFYYI